jgi:predicted RNA binding protein YcfA (HicA-like mRNA interferase family)
MKVRELQKLMTADGWYMVRQKGSHQQYQHPTKKGTITLAGHRPSDDVPPGLANAILRQAGLK